MVGSKDMPPSHAPFSTIFYHNQFKAQPQWAPPDTNLSGKVAIITGGNSGLGYETAVQLLELGLSHLVLGVRSVEKGEAAASRLRTIRTTAQVDVWPLDMASYESVQSFARRVESQLTRIDFVLLNAGVMRLEFGTVAGTGHEEDVQVNYLSTVLLAILLLPVLKAKRAPGAAPSHLTFVSSALSLAAKLPTRDAVPLLPSLDDPAAWDRAEHYNSSKVFAHMFLWKLVDYVSADDVIVNLADPAWVRSTALARDAKGALKLFGKLFGLLGRTPKVGASCFVDAMVLKGAESHGCFIMSWKVHP